MQIGELAKATGVSVRALRHYEKQGLLASRRAENGYRVFRADSADRVGYIRLFLSCGFATREIAQFLPCYVDQANFDKESCPLGYEQHLEKLAEIEELIAVLNDRRDRLHHAIANFGATTVERLSVSTTARQVA
ncbi:MerR family transcriptional regulator [Thalassospira sp. A3_1]|uniref:MerR family transcriptional regulator n=1 Tax=Thalassospira sp. A3_1 TaxID=2821088 RepID=UPI001ADB9442|nr:MerR family transcriptional regulator [Thalassospira sp. A3_1]MBO9508303.1 MerR family transcriptional regulator [Thalassospira sp. A3_1]